jgi:hypothetical protein
MKRGIKKFIKQAKAAASKGSLPKKTARLRELAQGSDAGSVLVKLRKDGVAEPRKSKAGATHVVIETPTGGAIAEPIKKWPKAPKELTVAAPIGAQPDEPSPHDAFASPIPPEATYLAWQTTGALMLMPIRFAEEYRHRKGGEVMFGKLRYGEDFVCISPEAKRGNVIRWRDGVTCFAEGQSPAELKAAARAAEQAEARRNAPETKAILEAGRAKRAATRPPGEKPKQPAAGSKTGAVWAIADAIFAKEGRTPTKAEMVAGDGGKTNSGTLMTQFSAWRRFHGRT